MNNKELENLYKSLRDNNYDVPDNYDDFEYTLTEDKEARKSLYKSLKDNNYDVPDEYDDFDYTLFGQDTNNVPSSNSKLDGAAAVAVGATLPGAIGTGIGTVGIGAAMGGAMSGALGTLEGLRTDLQGRKSQRDAAVDNQVAPQTTTPNTTPAPSTTTGKGFLGDFKDVSDEELDEIAQNFNRYKGRYTGDVYLWSSPIYGKRTTAGNDIRPTGGRSLQYRTGLDNLIKKAINQKKDLGLTDTDRGNMSMDELVAERDRLAAKYPTAAAESHVSLQDAYDLNNIEFEIGARNMGFANAHEMNNQKAGERDYILLTPYMNKEWLTYYANQGSGGISDTNDPLFLDEGWDKLVGIINDYDNWDLGTDRYIELLFEKYPDLQEKFEAYCLNKAKRTVSQSYTSIVNEELDDLRSAISNGYNHRRIAPDPDRLLADKITELVEEYESKLPRAKRIEEKQKEEWKAYAEYIDKLSDYYLQKYGFGWQVKLTPEERKTFGEAYAKGNLNALFNINTPSTATYYLLKDTKNLVSEAMKHAKEWSMSNQGEAFFRGLWDRATDWRTWTFGIMDHNINRDIERVADKFLADKEKLTESEELMLDALALKAVATEYLEKYIITGYDAGSTAADAVEFMAEIGVGEGAWRASAKLVNGAISKLAKFGGKLGGKLGQVVSKLLQKYGAKFLNRIGFDKIQNGIAKALSGSRFKGIGRVAVPSGVKTFGRLAGKTVAGVGEAAGKGVVNTLYVGVPHVMSTASEYRRGQVVTNYNQETGKFEAVDFTERKDPLDALTTAFLSEVGERGSEYLGDTVLSKFLKKAGGFRRAAGKKVLDTLHLDKASRFLAGMKKGDMYRAVADFKKFVHYNGTLGEYMEEVANNIYNAAVVHEMNFNDPSDERSVFNLKNNVKTYMTCKMMGGAFGAVNAVSYRTPIYRARKAVERADDFAKQVFNANGKDWSTLSDFFKTAAPEKMEQMIVDIARSENYTPAQRQAALNYAGTLLHLQGLETGEAKVEAPSGTDAMLQDLYGRGYNAETVQSISAAIGSYEKAKRGMSWMPPELLEMIDEDAAYVYDWAANNPNWSEQEKQQLMDYINARATYEGAIQRLQDDTDAAIAASEQAIDMRTNKKKEDGTGDGLIHPAVLKNGQRVYITGGEVTADVNGGLQSNQEEIIVVDEAGKTSMIPYTDIKTLEDPSYPEEEMQTAAAAIQAEAEKVYGTVPEETEEVDTEATDDASINGNEQNNGDQVQPNELGPDTTTGTATATNEDAQGQTQGATTSPIFSKDDTITVEVDGQRINGQVTREVDDSGNMEIYVETPVNNSHFIEVTPEQLNGMLVNHTPAATEGTENVGAPSQQTGQQPSQPAQVETPNQNVDLTNPGLNDEVTLTVNGEQVTGTVDHEIDDNGTIGIHLDTPINGAVNIEVTPEQLMEMASQPEQAAAPTQAAAEETVSQQPNGELDVQTGESSQQSADVAAPTAEQAEATTAQAEPIAQEPQAPAQPSLPVGEDGNADFSNATPQEAHDYIYNDPELDEEEADQVVQNYAAQANEQLAQAQAALDQAESVPAPVMKDYGTDVAGYKRAKKQRNDAIAQAQAAVAAAQRGVDLWNGVQAQRMMARAQRAAEQRAPIAGENGTSTPVQGTVPGTQTQPVAEPTETTGVTQNGATSTPSAQEQTPSTPEDDTRMSSSPGRTESQPTTERSAEEMTADERIEQTLKEHIKIRAQELVEACGIPVTLAESLEDLAIYHRQEVEKQHAAGQLVNGFYDTRTNEIVLFLPDIMQNGGIHRLDITYLHEGAAHGGLRALFQNAQNGIQTFNDLCDTVWNSMSDADKVSRINYNRRNAGRKDLISRKDIKDIDNKTTQKERREAADEYMAQVAEEGVEQTTRDKIIVAVRKALRKLLKKVKDLRLSDREIIDLLSQSRTNLEQMDKMGINQEAADRLTAEAMVGTMESGGIALSATDAEDASKVSQAVDSALGGVMEGRNNEDEPLHFSVSAMAEGAGFKAMEDDGNGNVAMQIGDKVFNGNTPITVDDIKAAQFAPINLIIDDARALGTATEEQIEKIYNDYVGMLNRMLQKGLKKNGGFMNLAGQWRWVAETAFRTVHDNSDAQYGQSIDISTICKKNEAVINAISKKQVRQGFGVTPNQILHLYENTHAEGYQVPCPVCYVFSHYLTNGRHATIMINGWRKYGDKMVDPSTLSDAEKKKRAQWFTKEYNKAVAWNKAHEKEIAQAKADIQHIEDDIDKLSKKILIGKMSAEKEAEARRQVEALDARYRAAVDLIAQSSLDKWIKCFAINLKKDQSKNTLREDSWRAIPDEMALDFDMTAESLRYNPGVQRLRSSDGSSGGKYIHGASNNEVGEVLSMLGLSDSSRDAVNPWLEASRAKTEKERNTWLKKARDRFKNAVKYMSMQSLRGGQRMWSWSDNIESLAPDVYVNLMQLQLLGGTLQSYSKQLEGIDLVARMGGYVNGSLMGAGKGYRELNEDEVERTNDGLFVKDGDFVFTTDEGETVTLKAPVYELDGKYYTLEFDDVVGVSAFGKDENGNHLKGLFELNYTLDKAGNILVGMNDMHNLIAMADPRIYFIIPYHKSGLSAHMLMSMYNLIGVEFIERYAQNYEGLQEDTFISADEDVQEPLVELWESHKNEDEFACGIEGGIPSNSGKLSDQQKEYRALRNAIFTDKNLDNDPARLAKIKADEFLNQVYEAVRGRSTTGMMQTKDTQSIYPYEYWDENSTYDNADVNGRRYVEYCRRMGVRPKFSGMTQNGNVSDHGNFVDAPGYWKTLIDRRMYDTNGNYQGLDAVDTAGFDVDLVDPEVTATKFPVTRVADAAGTERIVDRTEAEENEMFGGKPLSVNYDMTGDQALKKYNKAVETSRESGLMFSTASRRDTTSVDAVIVEAGKETNTEPTDAQKEAGNYKKGHVKIDGFDVSIEQPKGSVRSGVDATGKAWSQTMNNTYGYIRGTEGVDGDHIDVFFSDNLDGWNGTVYVVDQVNKDGSFDEHKVMYGFNSEEEARKAYLSNYEDGWDGDGAITGVSKEEFKKWIDSSHRKTKPFAEYKNVKVEDLNATRFSTSPVEEKTLMGVHNITAEKLKSAIGLGGLANPSMAVVDTTKGLLNNFGEISLIPGSALIDSKTGRNAGTWAADAYTPRFPKTHRRLGKGGDKKLKQWLDGLGMRQEMNYNTQDQFNDYYNGFDIQDNALVYPFLYERGMADAVDTYDHNKVSAPYRELISEYDGDLDALMDAFDNNEEVMQQVTDIVIDDMVRDSVKKQEGESFSDWKKRRRALRQEISENLLNMAGYLDRDIARDILKKECEKYVEGSRFNPEATRQAASIYIDKNGLREEYNKYRDEKLGELGVETQMYAGSDSQGRSKFKPVTLEAVSKEMKKHGRAGAESGFGSGPGGVRARVTPRLNTLKQIKAERGRIQNDIDGILQDYTDEFFETARNIFNGSTDILGDVLASNDMRAAAKEHGYELEDSTIGQLRNFRDRMFSLPTEYFETKFERPVALNEFEAAIVPNDVDPEIREALEGAGLDVREYNPGEAGDREKVTLEAANDAGNVLFSTTGPDAFTPYPDDVVRTERVRKDLAGLQLKYNFPRIHLFDDTVTVEDLMAIDKSGNSENEKRKDAENAIKEIDEQKIGGYYFPDSGEIAIFAQNIKSPIILENTLFHESFHGWLDHSSDKELIKKMLDAFYAQGESIDKDLYDALNKSESYIEGERPEEFLARKIDEAMSIGELENGVFRYLPREFQILIDNFLNDIGYERREEEPRRRETIKEFKRIRSKKFDSQSPNIIQVTGDNREANNGEGRDETQGISLSTSAAEANDAAVESDSGVMFSVREKPAPEKTIKVYKLMRLNDNNELCPLFIDGTEPIELGVWYDADSPNMDMLVDLPAGVHLIDTENGTSMTMEEYYKQNGLKLKNKQKYPSKEIVESTPNGQRWVFIEPTERAQRRFGGEARRYWNIGINGSGSVSTFSMRPGWHAGSLPTMRQIGKGANRDLRDDRFVWVEGLISADIDYNEEAQGNPDNDIPTHIPTDGFYMKATNANAKASQADRVGWYISGAFMPVRIMSDSEARQVIDDWNQEHPDLQVEYDFPRESGKVFNAETMQLEDEPEARFSTSEAVAALKDDERVYNDLLGKVFSGVSNETRRGIVGDAMENRGNDFGAATEAWLRGLADDEYFDMVPEEDWRAVKNALSNTLRDNGVEGTMTDNEARYVLWKAGQIEDGVFSLAEDIVKRDELLNGALAPQYTESADVRFSTSSSEEESGESGEDLMFSMSPRDRSIARDQYERWMGNARMQWSEAMQDSMLGLKKLMQAIVGKQYKYIEDIPMYENAYVAENLMSSVTAAEQAAFYRDFMKPLLKQVSLLCKGKKKQREEKRQELNDYLMAKHGLERNVVLADRDAQETAADGGNYQDAYNENRKRDYSGLTELTGENDVQAAEAAAQQMVAAYEAAHDTTELWTAINAATQATLDKQYQSGILSKASYEKIRDMFEYYIPLRGWDETTSDEVYGYLTSNAGPILGGSIMKRAGGRTTKADDPIANISMLGDDSVRTGNRNLMKQNFLRFVENHPSDLVSVSELWLQYDDVKQEWVPVFANIPSDATAEKVVQIVEQFEADMAQLAQQQPNRYKSGREAANIPYRVIPGMEKEHQVLVKRGGRTYVLTINGNPRAAQALNGITNPDVKLGGHVSATIRFFEKVNRFLSSLYTTYNPAFIVSNFLRDSIYSNNMVWIKEKSSWKLSKNYPLKFNINYYKTNPVTMRRLLGKWENGTLDDSKPMQKMFREFMEHGGETGYAMAQELDDYKKKINKELGIPNSKRAWKRAVIKATPETMKKMSRLFGEQYELLGRSIENCARFAAFMTSRQMGRSVERAAYDAKEISVNFNKKGAGGKVYQLNGQTRVGNIAAFMSGWARNLYTFWNAGVQGMTNISRAAKRHPAKAATMLFGKYFAMGFFAPMLGAAMSAALGDDDKNAYYNLPEYVRRSNICIWAGGAWITIPLPIELRAIYGLGELTYGWTSGNERYDTNELVMQYASQLSQIMPIDMLEGGGGFHPFIPTLLKPIVEAEQNVSWSGTPIYKDTPFNKDDPEWTKAFSNTSGWLVASTEMLNAITGGDEYKKGWLDWNPAKIEYLLKGYLGGLYSFPNDLMKTAGTLTGSRDFEWRNIPLANRVLKQGDERLEAKKLKSDYFRYKEEYEKTKRLLDKYSKAESSDLYDYAKKLDILNHSKEYRHYEIFKNMDASMVPFREKAEEARAEGDMEIAKQYEDMELELMRQMVKMINDSDDGKAVDPEAAMRNVLMHVLNTATDATLRGEASKELAKSHGAKDSLGSDDAAYNQRYVALRNGTDVDEDAQLQKARRNAKDLGETELYEAFGRAIDELATMRKGVHAKTKRKVLGLGEGDAENDKKIMEKIRQRRREILKMSDEEIIENFPKKRRR